MTAQFNSDMHARDNEGLSPLDIVMLDKPAAITYGKRFVFSWSLLCYAKVLEQFMCGGTIFSFLNDKWSMDFISVVLCQSFRTIYVWWDHIFISQ